MGKSRVCEIYKYGQSVWYDNISRGLLASGELARLVEAGEVTGVTSNPSIFQKAIAGSADYDEAIAALLAGNPEMEPEALYERLAVEDVRAACDLLRPVYERTGGVDGYVSLEVSPALAHDTEGTVAEAHRLFAEVDRPNLMIKVPATAAGLPAVTRLIAEGVNVNVTLMFSVQDYLDVSDAYLAGLEARAEAGKPLDEVASVASFFVSRIDTAVDAMLPEDSPLRGKTAIANTKVAYSRFREVFSGERFAALKRRGARVQRFLCASTSTKNPAYPDLLYAEALIGPDTIDTMPPATLTAFRDHGVARETITEGLDEARAHLAALAEAGIDVDEVCRRLKDAGVRAFAEAYEALLSALAQKREAILAGKGA